MALKKACCPHCHSTSGANSVFEINADAKICFCPNCMKQIDPKEAMEEYDKLMNELVNEADSLLFESTDGSIAYKAYASIIEIDNDFVRAKMGRIIALITLSTLRKPQIRQALDLFKIDYDKYFKYCNKSSDYTMFYYRLSLILVGYHYMMRKRLTYRDYFYDLECLTFYFSRLMEVMEFLDVIDAAMEKLENVFLTDKTIPLLRKHIRRMITRDKIYFNGECKYPMCNGLVYMFGEFDKDKTPLFIRDKYAVNPKLPLKLIPTLNKTKHHHMIRDDLFKNRRKRFVFYRRSLKLILTSGIIATLLAIVAGFTYNRIDIMYWAIIISLMGASILTGLIFIIIRVVIRKKVKSRHELYYNIDIEE